MKKCPLHSYDTIGKYTYHILEGKYPYYGADSTGSSGWSFHLNRTSFMQQTRENFLPVYPVSLPG